MGYALMELGRFDEAIVAGKKALRQNPSHPVTCRCVAAAFAHLGRDAEAHEAAAHLLELVPPLQFLRGLPGVDKQRRSC